MATYPYPLIDKQHYKSFQKVVAELPGAYETWSADIQRKKDKDRLSHRAVQNSFDQQDVPIDRESFVAYCERKRQAPTVHMLWQFAYDNMHA